MKHFTGAGHGPADRDREFAAFVAESSPRLLGAAYLMAGDLGTAEDLVQEALLRVYCAWSRIEDMTAAPAYAHRTLARIAYRRLGPWRSWRLSLTASLPDASAPEGGLSWEARAEIRDALAEVPMRQRQAVVLRFFSGLSVDDTARAMGCSPGTVKSQTADGLRRMRAVLASLDADDPVRTTTERTVRS